MCHFSGEIRRSFLNLKLKQMKRIACFCLLCFATAFSLKSQVPAKYDSLYKRIYAKDLCKLALQNPGLVLIDVRSPGEYSDTSQYNSLNMGHLKSAININVDTILKNVSLLEPYKNKTVVLYCSHSQRSRRVSKLLSENGFTDFYNLNGGMSQLNQMTENEFPCKSEWLVSNLKYTNLSSKDAIDFIKKNPNLVIVDIRPAALFNSKDSLEENNIGRIKNAVNIPYADLEQKLPGLEKYKNQPVFIYSQTGDGDAARAADKLTANGYAKVYHLLAGLDDLLTEEDAGSIMENPMPFKLVDGKGALALLKTNNRVTIYDTRPKIEFENKVTGREVYKNIGSIKNAVNLEEKDFAGYNYPKDKQAPVLIYGRGEAFKLANKLSTSGYKNVYVMRGLYGFISCAFNVEGCKDALQYLVNHEGLY